MSRPRNAAATRAAILDAAKDCFAAEGYRASVRSIADRAGADVSLISRYFGSKDGLFLEVIRSSPNIEESEGPAGVARLVDHVLAMTDGDLRPLVTWLLSAPSPEAREMLREVLDDGYILPLARGIGGQEAQPRAAVVTAMLIGYVLIRDVAASAAIDGPLRAQADALVREVIAGAAPAPKPARRRTANPKPQPAR